MSDSKIDAQMLHGLYMSLMGQHAVLQALIMTHPNPQMLRAALSALPMTVATSSSAGSEEVKAMQEDLKTVIDGWSKMIESVKSPLV